MRDVLLVTAIVVLAVCWVSLLLVWRQVRASRASTAAVLARLDRLRAEQDLLAAEAERLTRALDYNEVPLANGGTQ